MSSLKHKDQIDPEADTGHQNFGFQNEMEGNSTREDTNHSNTQELVVDDLIHKDIDGNKNNYFVSIEKQIPPTTNTFHKKIQTYFFISIRDITRRSTRRKWNNAWICQN